MAVRKFNNLEEINQYLTNETKKALEDTLRALAPRLKAFIRANVYHAYRPLFYRRTRWLMRSGVVEYYMSNLQGKVRGGVHITNKMYNETSDLDKFQHGHPRNGHEPARQLSAEDFVEILNDETNDWIMNPYNFPYFHRKSFWEDYIEWVKKNYAEIFKRKCRNRGIDLNNLGATESSSPEPPKGKEPSPEPPNTSISGTSNDIGRVSIGKGRSNMVYKYVNPYTQKTTTSVKQNESALTIAMQIGQYDNT